MNKLLLLIAYWYQSCKDFNVCNICEQKKFCENLSGVLEKLEEN